MTTEQSTISTTEMLGELVTLRRELLDSARARLDRLGPDDPLYPRAEALVASSEQGLADAEKQLGEAVTTAEASGGVDALTRNMQHLDDLRRSYREQRNAREAELAADGRYSNEYRAELMQAWDAEWVAEAEQAARTAWRTYQSAEAAMERDMHTAHREAEGRYDLARVGVLVKDYAAQMQAPPVPQGMEKDRTHRLAFIGEMLDRADRSGDPDAQRAARIAAAPMVRQMMGTSDSDADRMSRDLHRKLGAMATSERGRAVEVERNQRELAKRGKAIRSSILGLEQATTGKSGGIYGVSPWASAILGESMETYGGGVADMGEK